MSFRKAVAQAYSLHKHIVKEYLYEKHFCGAELTQSAFEKKGGLLCFSPLQTLRSRSERSEACLRSRGSQMDLADRMEMARPFSTCIPQI